MASTIDIKFKPQDVFDSPLFKVVLSYLFVMSLISSKLEIPKKPSDFVYKNILFRVLVNFLVFWNLFGVTGLPAFITSIIFTGVTFLVDES